MGIIFNAVKNFSVSVEEEGEKIVFLRKIVSGEADKSYGVHVARLAGMPKSVVKRALEVMDKLEDSSLVRHLPTSIKGAKKKQDLPTSVSGLTENSFHSKVDENQQLSLFPEETKLMDELLELNLNDMSPHQALNYLYELLDKLRKNN